MGLYSGHLGTRSPTVVAAPAVRTLPDALFPLAGCSAGIPAGASQTSACVAASFDNPAALKWQPQKPRQWCDAAAAPEAMKGFCLSLFAAVLSASPVFAVLPGEQLADPRLEARARAISQDLRCVVCQNQTIDDSDATLAHDLRLIVRERLKAGDTDDAVKAYIVQRYGSYVLLDPPLEPATVLLWFGPLVVLIAGTAGSWIYLRRRRAGKEPLLTNDEEVAIARLLAENRH